MNRSVWKEFFLTASILVLSLSVGKAEAANSNLGRAHSHNDYEQTHPLFDALIQHFSSVEADVWLRNGELQISHMGFAFRGSLKELYLDPLQRLVDRHGSVHGDKKQFILWIDIKEKSQALRNELSFELAQYSMFTTFGGDHPTQRAVTVILTGDENSKAKFVAGSGERRATRDSGLINAKDPAGDDRWSWYALDLKKYVDFEVGKPLSSVSEQKLIDLVSLAHSKGRKLRFWDVPEDEAIWRTLMDAGVDQISTDDLPRMRKFMDSLTETTLDAA